MNKKPKHALLIATTALATGSAAAATVLIKETGLANGMGTGGLQIPIASNPQNYWAGLQTLLINEARGVLAFCVDPWEWSLNMNQSYVTNSLDGIFGNAKAGFIRELYSESYASTLLTSSAGGKHRALADQLGRPAPGGLLSLDLHRLAVAVLNLFRTPSSVCYREVWKMSTTTVIRTLALAILIALTSGCASRGEVPMTALHYENTLRPAAEEKKLLVLLRGAGGGNEVFKNNGVVDQVIERGLPFDIVAPDAHAGYYAAETLERRLYEDIILPARRQGYSEIWVAGTSMGGLGALLLLIEYPDAVDGVILLSPFLGWPGIVREIRDAGGLERWQPGPHTIEDWQRYLWNWVKHYQQEPERFPPIYLGYGDSDFFSKSQGLLAEALPEGHTVVASGGHTYGTMRRLWSEHLEKLEPELRQRAKVLAPVAAPAKERDEPPTTASPTGNDSANRAQARLSVLGRP